MNNNSGGVNPDMRYFTAITGVVLLLLITGIVVAAGTATAKQLAPSLRDVSPQQVSADAVVVDTRALAACQRHTIADARCLPATDLLGPNGELPGFADIFWALGTAGLDGSETVLVTGDQPAARNFVAGLLYLCGQARVEILNTPVERALHAGLRHAGQGHPRGILRQRIYHASMRDQLLVLPAELSHAAGDMQRIIPIHAGSRSSSAPDLSGLLRDRRNTVKDDALFVIHGGQPRDAIALFARLLANSPDYTGRIRVMPVARLSLFSNVDFPVISHNRATPPAFIVIVTEGGKQWT